MTATRPLREVTLERACSRLSLSCSESLRGTASTVRHWLLVEQPGAWGRDAVFDSDLPTGVAATLSARAAAHDVRVVLIRRPGRHTAKSGPRSAYLVHSGPSEVWHRRLTFTSPHELLDIDLGAQLHSAAGGIDQPIYLVLSLIHI